MHNSKLARLLQNPATPAFASALLAVLLYAVTLGGTYVYDDLAVVRDDQRLHTPVQWHRIWSTDYFDGGVDNLYRPIITSSYALEWSLHGDRPWIFHAINILLHAMVAGAVAEFTRRMLASAAIAQSAGLIAGLLFAAHPVHVEAVANIVGRAELLCTFCIFLAMIFLIRRPLTLSRIFAVLTVGLLAMLSKEQGMLQPMLWLLLVYLLWQGSTGSKEKLQLQYFILATSWVWAVYLIAREHYLPFEWDRTRLDTFLNPLLLSHGIDRLLMPVVLIGHYTGLLLLPLHLSLDYSGDVFGSVAHFSDPFLWIGFGSIAIWLAVAAACLIKLLSHQLANQHTISANKIRHMLQLFTAAIQRASPVTRSLLFCLLGFAITYGMIGNIVSLLVTNFGERLIYLPSAFFLIVIAVVVSYLPLKLRCIGVAIVLGLMSLRTVTFARYWNQPTVLFEHALAAEPKSIQLTILLSQRYNDHGKTQEALAMMKGLCNRYPDYWALWMYRTAEDIDAGRIEDAKLSLTRALKLKADPKLWRLGDELGKLIATTRPTTHP